MNKDRVFSDRLNLLDAKLDKILEILTADKQDGGLVEDAIPEEAQLIEVPGMEAPWVLKGLEWDGKSEVDNEKELTDWLGFNPNDQKADGKSWCAGFWLKIFEELGFDVSDLNLSAISFASFGYDLLQTFNENDLPDGAILVFQPNPDGDFPISHVGVKVDDDKLFGGNQGNKAKRSNLAWYLANAQLVAARCPDGYKLV